MALATSAIAAIVSISAFAAAPAETVKAALMAYFTAWTPRWPLHSQARL